MSKLGTLIAVLLLAIPIVLMQLLFLPFRLFDYAFDKETDWTNSPYDWFGTFKPTCKKSYKENPHAK